jgi:hypothetical protein
MVAALIGRSVKTIRTYADRLGLGRKNVLGQREFDDGDVQKMLAHIERLNRQRAARKAGRK